MSGTVVATGVLTPAAGSSRLVPGEGQDEATTLPPQSSGPAGHGPLGIGESFGPRYHILRLLGIGGMGAVYHAWDQELAVAVALKVIRPEVLRDPGAAGDLERRFKRELLLARQVTHKNVVRIHDLGELGGIKYITMPYVEGADLATVLKREGRLPVERALKIASQIAAGLAAAHDVGVVHRDLKPANIMVSDNDHVLIMDFGIARSVANSTGETMAGDVVGTIEYMAPEQARGEPVDRRADIYAFGLILYDLLLGRRPIADGESNITELMRRMQHAPPSASSIDPAIPRDLAHIIDTCLHPDPAARFQTTQALAGALAQLGAGEPASGGTQSAGLGTAIHPRVARGIGRLRGWRLALVGGAVVLAAVPPILGALRWASPPPSPASESVPGAAAAAVDRKRVAVLPFTAAGSALAPVATGLGEALSAKLFQLTGVGLASGVEEAASLESGSPERIGRELGVNFIISGTVQSSGNRLQIDVALDDVAAGSRVWTRQYSGLTEDLLFLEDQIYEGLVSALGVTPGSDDQARAIAHPTENFEAYELYLKGRNAMRGRQDLKNVQTAIAFYEQAAALDPGFALAYTGIADGALQVYRFTRESAWASRALSAAEQAARLDDMLLEVHLALGNVYQATGRVAESIAELRVATQLAPNSDDAHRRLGRAYLRGNRAAEAIEAYEKAVAVNPYFWLNHNSLGAAFLQLGEYDRAIQANLKVIELEPDNVNGYNDLGATYLQTGRFEQAAGAFEQALNRLPNPETYTNLGIAYYYEGKFKEAVPMYEKAVELSPNAEQFVGNLADGYRWAGLTERAVDTYDRAIALALEELRVNPRNAIVRANLGLYYSKKGDVARGVRFVTDARDIDRTNVNLVYNEALAYALANRPSEAITALSAAFEAGYPLSMASSDPDLKALQSDPRYAELVTRFSKPR